MAEIVFHDLESTVVRADSKTANALTAVSPQTQVFIKALIEIARKEWGDDIWRWYDEHQNDAIVTIKKWFISFTFRVKHCEALIKVIAGSRPEGV